MAQGISDVYVFLFNVSTSLVKCFITVNNIHITVRGTDTKMNEEHNYRFFYIKIFCSLERDSF